ncbi:MAG TPA: carbohydrate ABC transporter permease [Candidatus Scatosoma pullistercoris]|uniref:Carbohydrate ABC transporter permease n=1 Tax=Candidatus Scatosoma pullistercoris TaxID=2840934 RepID=A0A9D1SGI8_9FIRM|nr:carbohydrate ABC transporter permease [Candidatus Scatosoma pullistercoris]
MKKHGTKVRQSLSRKIVFTVAFFLFVLYTAYILFFFLFGVLIALKTDMQAYTADQINKRLFSWPEHPAWGNFGKAFGELAMIDSKSTFLSILWNSVWRTSGSAFLSIMASAMVCYVLVFYRSRFTRFMYNLGLFVAILPLYGSAGSMYKLLENLGLLNNPLILVADISLFGGYFFYMYATFKTLSWDYAEAAFIDGANHFQVFFKVMLPMALPGIAALFIMQFIGCWNNYESTILYMKEYPNLSYALYAYDEVKKYDANVPVYFAGVLVALIPVLALFFAFQNTIMERVYLGGLKG